MSGLFFGRGKRGPGKWVSMGWISKAWGGRMGAPLTVEEGEMGLCGGTSEHWPKRATRRSRHVMTTDLWPRVGLHNRDASRKRACNRQRYTPAPAQRRALRGAFVYSISMTYQGPESPSVLLQNNKALVRTAAYGTLILHDRVLRGCSELCKAHLYFNQIVNQKVFNDRSDGRSTTDEAIILYYLKQSSSTCTTMLSFIKNLSSSPH